MSLEKRIEKLKLAFSLSDVTVEKTTEGLISKKVQKFLIPEANFVKALQDFPVLENALKAGLFKKDKLSNSYIITSDTLSANQNDKRKFGSKQFFSLKGNDKEERTTAYDMIYTIQNIRSLAAKLALEPKDVNYTIRHKDGDPEEVMNFVELDKSLFGQNDKEVNKKVDIVNKLLSA